MTKEKIIYFSEEAFYVHSRRKLSEVFFLVSWQVFHLWKIWVIGSYRHGHFFLLMLLQYFLFPSVSWLLLADWQLWQQCLFVKAAAVKKTLPHLPIPLWCTSSIKMLTSKFLWLSQSWESPHWNAIVSSMVFYLEVPAHALTEWKITDWLPINYRHYTRSLVHTLIFSLWMPELEIAWNRVAL